MNNPVLILYLEDDPRDAELVRDKLQQTTRLACELRVASDRTEYEAALAQTRFDLILSDYKLPNYDGMAALAWARAKQPDVPFILVSGTLGEEQAVDCVLRGATDYVLKQRLDRLVSAVLRALTEAEEHQKRRKAEEMLCASEARYRRLFEAAKDGILILDAETGMVVDVNPFLSELLGFSREAFLGKEIWELGFFKDIVPNQDNFAELQQQEYIRYEDKPLETADGRKIDVEFVSNVYLVNHHKVIQCNIRDITERKRAEQELRESKALVDAVVENVPLMIFLKEATDLRFVIFNRAGEELLGYDRKALLGKNNLDLFPPEQATHFMAKDREVLDGESGMLDIPEESILTAKKGQRLLHTRKVCIRGADGTTKFLLGISEDITERKRAEAALEKAHQELIDASRQAGIAEFATGVLHNIRNVLNSVSVASTCVADNLRRSKSANLSKVVALLRDHQADLGDFLTNDPRGKSVFEYLAQLAGQLAAEQAAVLQELAGLQKNITHIKEVVLTQQSMAIASGVAETLSITELVEDAVRMNASNLAHRRIQVIRQFEEVPPFAIEKNKVLQILVNLVRNAEQAYVNSDHKDKTLTLHVTRKQDRARVAISDNGVGIPPENLEQIFSYGFTTKKDGHGFGLCSCAVAAREIGGSLTVHSDGPGQGASFTLEIPYHRPELHANNMSADKNREVVG